MVPHMYRRIQSFFPEHYFIRSASDHSLFINYEKQVILLLYVDNLVVGAPTQNIIGWIRTKLHQEFKMTKLGPLDSFSDLERKRKTQWTNPTSFTKQVLSDDSATPSRGAP